MSFLSDLGNSFSDPFKQIGQSFQTLVTNPGKLNFGDFGTILVPGLGGLIVNDVKHPTDAAVQGTIVAAAAGGAYLAGGTTLPSVGTVASAAASALRQLDLLF